MVSEKLQSLLDIAAAPLLRTVLMFAILSVVTCLFIRGRLTKEDLLDALRILSLTNKNVDI